MQEHFPLYAIKSAVVVNPEVSWLLCTHTIDETLFDAVNSCLCQRGPVFEVVMVANGDKAIQIAKQIAARYHDESRITIVASSLRYLTHSLNMGLELCRADLVARLDADDMAHPERMQVQVEFMRMNPNVCILGTAYHIIDHDGNCKGIKHLPTKNRDIRKALLWGNPLCHPSVMYRKSVVLNVGGYMGGIQAEDYDLWLRISLNESHQFAALSAPYVFYRSVSMSGARRSRLAYAAVASAQFRIFVLSMHPKWLAAAFFTLCKRLFRA